MIDITNYETWFLLYADNELSAEEQSAVLSFVKQHPALQHELDGILQLRFLPGDSQHQINKASLFSKSMEDSMQAALAEHRLLMNYMDGELSIDERAELESRLANDAAFMASFKQLHDLKLVPDHSIVHPDKASLYKHTKIVAIGWRRPLAAAAAIIISVGLFWIFNQSEDSKNATVVKVAPESTKPNSLQQHSAEKIDLITSAYSSEAPKKKSITKVNADKINDPELKPENYLAQEVSEPFIQPSKSEEKIIDPVPTGNTIVSNNLPVPNASLVSEALNDLSSIQESFVNENDDDSKNAGRKPFKTLTRKINRMFGKEREQSDQVKFIQVANFQVAVSKQ